MMFFVDFVQEHFSKNTQKQRDSVIPMLSKEDDTEGRRHKSFTTLSQKIKFNLKSKYTGRLSLKSNSVSGSVTLYTFVYVKLIQGEKFLNQKVTKYESASAKKKPNINSSLPDLNM